MTYAERDVINGVKSMTILNSQIEKWPQKLLTDRFFDLGGGCEDTLLLAGCARSGSTWVSDIANYDNLETGMPNRDPGATFLPGNVNYDL